MRSPNYPSIGLAEAIMAAKILWDKEKKTAVDTATIAADWGYTSISGRVRSKLGALRKYGLVEDVGDGTKISETAVRILYSEPETPDHIAALREAALTPGLFRELYQTHPDASEQAIKSYLVIKKAFSDKGAREAARAFRETIEVAKLVGSDYTPRGDTIDDVEDEMSVSSSSQTLSLPSVGSRHQAPASDRGQPTQGTVAGTLLFAGMNTNPVGDWIPVSPDCKMRVWADGEVTQAGIDKLIKYLQLVKDTFPGTSVERANEEGEKP